MFTDLQNINIDYLTVSLDLHKTYGMKPTSDVLHLFASILPEQFKMTSRDMFRSEGHTERVSQYGICAALQYGTAIERGWVYSVQLSGDYWHAIERNREAVLKILDGFSEYRVSRLDLEKTVPVPLEDWRHYCHAAFLRGYRIIGGEDALTISYGSRQAQFYTRVYNKTANDPKHYPAPDGQIQARLETEIHRVTGELILEPAFLNPAFADRLFLQRLRKVAEHDYTGFIKKYFDDDSPCEGIKTVKRKIGNLEDSVKYVFEHYSAYIEAGLKSKAIQSQYAEMSGHSKKAEKILAVLDSEVSEGANHE